MDVAFWEFRSMNCRIGAVSYLNTKPLIHGLAQRLDHPLRLDLPSRLANDLAADRFDVALIPSVEFLRSEGWKIVSDACIACRGPVRSVRLLFRVPPAEVRSLALDEGSRTSAVLSRVLLFQRFGIRPELQPLPIEADYRQASTDAVLVIGDRAMRLPDGEFLMSWDLGQQWWQQTGFPFVFAMWVAKPDTATVELSHLLAESRNAGLRDLGRIAAEESPRHGLSIADCLRYFKSQLHFTLGPRELAGLELFRTQATELGLVPSTCSQLTLVPS